MKLKFTVACMAVCCAAVSADVVVYPGLKSFQSDQYAVRITQGGKIFESFVYQDENQFKEKQNDLTDWNHFTIFSFSGPITVEVEKLTGPIKSSTVYPLAKTIVPRINGSKMTFALDAPAKLYLAMEGQDEHPLFIFADTLEQNIPSLKDTGVVAIAPGTSREDAIAKIDANPQNSIIYFEPGIHRLGLKFPIKPDKTYYIPGGTMITATFFGNGVSNVVFRGRGIITGRDFGFLKGSPNIPNTVIYFGYGDSSNQLIEGITLIDPPHFCIITGDKSIIRNVKMFGWWYSTDGVGTGDDSLTEDCFLKVNDDSIKLYDQQMEVRDCVIWQEMNGAPFQFSWGNASGSDGSVKNIDLIHCEVTHSQGMESNRAFINVRKGNTQSRIQNFVFENIRIDQNIGPIIGINTTGTFKNITIKNMAIRGRQMFDSYLKGGDISGIRFENLTIGGKCVSSPQDIHLQTAGPVGEIKFQCATK